MLYFFSRRLSSACHLEKAHWQVAVAVWVLVEVVLVVFLGGVETVEWQHLGDDGLEVAFGLYCYAFFDDRQVGGINVVDSSAVLRSHVVPLLVFEGGVDSFEIHIEQELQSNLFGVINHLHCLGMPCLVGAHLLV